MSQRFVVRLNPQRQQHSVASATTTKPSDDDDDDDDDVEMCDFEVKRRAMSRHKGSSANRNSPSRTVEVEMLNKRSLKSTAYRMFTHSSGHNH